MIKFRLIRIKEFYAEFYDDKFIKNSENEVYRSMFAHMSGPHQKNMPSYEDGINAVRQKKGNLHSYITLLFILCKREIMLSISFFKFYRKIRIYFGIG